MELSIVYALIANVFRVEKAYRCITFLLNVCFWILRELSRIPSFWWMVPLAAIIWIVNFIVLRGLIATSHEIPIIRDRFWSVVIDYLTVRLNVGIRKNIQKHLTTIDVGVRQGHPHAESATKRNGATHSMIACARSLGLKPYIVSPSLREQDLPGTRNYHQLNDFNQQRKNDPIDERHCLIMTDIDYYINWEYWLSFRVPVLIYTFIPEKLAGSLDDGVFWCENNEFVTKVCGGGTYRHRLWDYSNDSSWVHTCGGPWYRRLCGAIARWLGIGMTDALIFSIDHFRVAEHRRIVALVPFAYCPLLLWNDTRTQLQYLDVMVDKSYAVMRVMRPDGPIMSVTKNGYEYSAQMTVDCYHGTRTRLNALTTKTLSDVVRFTNKQLSDNEAALFYEFLVNVQGQRVPAHIPSPGEFAQHFTCDGPNKDEIGKQYARRYAAPPLSQEAYYPTECVNNELICIEKRVDLPQQQAKSLITQHSGPRRRGKIPNRFYQYAREFVETLVPDVGVGAPLMNSDVMEIQNKPMQKLRSMRRVMDIAEKFVVSSFQKREAYNVPNDPRNISTVPTMHTVSLSAYTLSFKQDVLKKVDWYAPGLPPTEIANRIMQLCSNNVALVEGDYSRFDGTITHFLRTQIEQAAYLRWVKLCHLQELNELQHMSLNLLSWPILVLK